ncbi:MAG: hypothetical protein AB1798_07270 [Spirochaetota bacterium]
MKNRKNQTEIISDSPRAQNLELEQWKKIVLTLPETTFFEVMHNYLGKLKTPFNKHSLIESLTNLLNKPEIRKRILSLIDTEDAMLLTAIYLLKNPSVDDLYTFLGKEKPYLELHHHLLNLEERLLIYRNHELQSIEINPLFLRILLQNAIMPELLFPSHPTEASVPAPPWLNDSLLLAFLSFILKKPDILKAGGEMKKRVEAELGQIFPDLLKETILGHRFTVLINTLIQSRLLVVEENTLIPVLSAWKALSLADTRTRMLFLAAKTSAASGQPEDHFLSLRKAEIVDGLLNSLPPDRVFPFPTLEKMVLALSLNNKVADIIESENIIKSLIALDYIVKAGRGGYKKNTALILDGRKTSQTVAADKRAVVVQSNFDIMIQPWVNLEQGLVVSLISNITRYDLCPHYELEKHAFIRSCNYGYDSEKVCTILETLNGSPLPQNIVFSLRSWDKEYRSIGLFNGVVLTIDEDRRHLIEHSELIKPLIRKTVAPGVYLLDPAEQAVWHKALEEAGITPVPSIQTPAASGQDNSLDRTALHISPSGTLKVTNCRIKKPLPLRNSEGEPQELLDRLASLKLSKDQINELKARIKKKLILFPDQIQKGLKPQEKTEAKGLDYLGKVRLIEQALQTKTDLLEIIERAPDGSPSRLLLKPVELKKSGSDLLLTGKILPEETWVNIQVRKIGLLRKLKSSLFAP